MDESREQPQWSPASMELHLIDFTHVPDWRWLLRRFAISNILVFYSFYAMMFFAEIVSPGSTLLVEDGYYEEPAMPTGPAPYFDEETGEFVPSEEDFFEAELAPEQIPYNSKLLMMVSMGVAGSILLLFRTFVRTRRHRDLPVSWYALQPIQGGMMSLFLYFIFRSGETVLYDGGGEEAMNIYVMGSLAIVTGIFSERAFDSLLRASKTLLQVRGDEPKLTGVNMANGDSEDTDPEE